MKRPPKIKWIKNDKDWLFTDGTIVLVALQVTCKERAPVWELAVVQVQCDENMFNLLSEDGDCYDAWDWDDFEYFYVINGEIEERKDI